ncbi:hypothetical protein PSY31_23065, partial [Shigella flexneri]|nr:hypothetical protein [Shigella flexneri]
MGRKAEALTADHRPSREDERRRIEDKVCFGIDLQSIDERHICEYNLDINFSMVKQGGYVEFHRGTWRIHGSL